MKDCSWRGRKGDSPEGASIRAAGRILILYTAVEGGWEGRLGRNLELCFRRVGFVALLGDGQARKNAQELLHTDGIAGMGPNKACVWQVTGVSQTPVMRNAAALGWWGVEPK